MSDVTHLRCLEKDELGREHVTTFTVEEAVAYQADVHASRGRNVDVETQRDLLLTDFMQTRWAWDVSKLYEEENRERLYDLEHNAK